MADKPITELEEALRVTPTDNFVLEQEDSAKRLTGQTLINCLLKAIDGHGGVSGVTKVSTDGLVDTYRMIFVDLTTFDFYVTNGEKGEKGEKGETGAPAILVSSAVTYQVSDSGEIIPLGTWGTSIPVVPQGKYLWAKIVQTFNTGNPVTFYSVTRMGLDGSGSVVSVCGVSPDENGKVSLTAADVGAVPAAGGKMSGPLNMNGQTLSGLNAPAALDQAANKGYVDEKIKSYVLTLPASGWNGGSQTIAIAGVTADASKSDVFASPAPADDNFVEYAKCNVRLYAQLDGAVTFKCDTVPAIDLAVNVTVKV